MATVTNWVEVMESGQGQVYPYVGTEVWWLVPVSYTHLTLPTILLL